MKAANILLLCMLGAALLSTVLCNNGSGPDNCCFDFFRFPVNKNLIASYAMTDPRCTKTAVVLTGKKGRNICADPSQPWVKNVMNSLDRKSF
ncbi:C-C motif chemokine 4-like [Xiphophorus maculatus]|uniref:C-C motif chemokine 4-like n=1 Tax=Xiphophorus maculatus TaxID=8083 RepID=A0A3B5PZ18_XIPMA|nr:C-C motif chemokine 4-like [Xiphophorus maculatus]